jgi:uncharacterized membrane protein
MTQTNAPLASDSAGRGSAMLVYVLYLLSIPSAAIFALIGVIVSLSSLEGAAPLARAHLQNQVHVWMVAFWWWVVLLIVGVIGALLTIVLIGFPLLWLVGVTGFVVMLWFTIKSALGLLALLDNRAP